jgi:hypothetical protein
METNFKEWLIKNNEMKLRSASDVICRCGRVERILGIDLQKSIKTQADINKVLGRLTAEKKSYLSPKTKPYNIPCSLRRSIKLYGKFKKLK